MYKLLMVRRGLMEKETFRQVKLSNVFTRPGASGQLR